MFIMKDGLLWLQVQCWSWQKGKLPAIHAGKLSLENRHSDNDALKDSQKQTPNKIGNKKEILRTAPVMEDSPRLERNAKPTGKRLLGDVHLRLIDMHNLSGFVLITQYMT